MSISMRDSATGPGESPGRMMRPIVPRAAVAGSATTRSPPPNRAPAAKSCAPPTRHQALRGELCIGLAEEVDLERRIDRDKVRDGANDSDIVGDGCRHESKGRSEGHKSELQSLMS